MRATITIDANIAESYRVTVVWHEILHGLLYHAGDLSDHDEEMITKLSNGIVQVLRDNPELRGQP